MPLIKSQQTNVTLDPDGTLIDWVKVSDYDDLIVVVSNTGTDAIVGITLEQGNDGIGATATSGLTVPVGGITAGKALVITDISPSYDYVRVTAACDLNDDTTAIAWLLAETIAPHLCTLADLKDRLGFNSASDINRDSDLARIAHGVEAMFDNYVGYALLKSTQTFTLTGDGTSFLQVPARPLVSVTSVKISYDYLFTDAALVANSDYRLLNSGKTGMLHYCLGIWPTEMESIQVIAVAGYCGADIDPVTGEIALPSDLREAAIMQTCYLYQRKDDAGLQQVQYTNSSMTKSADTGLLPLIKDILDNYKIK